MPPAHFRRPWLSALLAAVVLAAPAVPGPRAQDSGFVTEIADLPLMPGLRQVPDAGLVFDKPEGRIVETYAQGPVNREAVLAFYRRTLPQLGWRAAGEAAFRREGEALSVDFLDGGSALIVRFTLVPE